MKFILISITALTILFTVRSDAAAPAIKGDPRFDSFGKSVPQNTIVKCNNESDTYKCLISLESAQSESSPMKDYYSDVSLDFNDKTKVRLNFNGECTNADQVLRALTFCGLQQCAEITCTK